MGIDSGKRKKFAMEEVACVTAAKPEHNLKSAWMIHYDGPEAVGVDAIHTALGTPLWLAHIDTVRIVDDGCPVCVALLHLRRSASASDMERVLPNLRQKLIISQKPGWAVGAEAGTWLDWKVRYGGRVERRLAGPLWLTASVSSHGPTAFVGLRLEF